MSSARYTFIRTDNACSVEEIECLREIQALRRLNHNPNIIQLEEVILYVRAPSDLHMLIRYSDAKYGVLSLAFELMDANLYEVLSKKGAPPIHEQRAKWVMWQIMKAMDFVHR
jgi:serine/threonine protein kinase